MIYRYTILIIVVMIFFSCNGQGNSEYNPEAIEICNKATHISHQNPDSAIVLYDKAIILDKDYYLPHANKAGIYVRRKQYDKAIYESEMAIKKKPDLAEGWTYAGMLYDSQGDSLKAKEYYTKSIEIFNSRIANPDKTEMIPSNQLNRAISYILLGNEEKGKAELRKLKTREPKNIMIDEFLKINKHDYINQMLGK